MKRNHDLKIVLSPDEKKLIKDTARQLHISMGNLMREVTISVIRTKNMLIPKMFLNNKERTYIYGGIRGFNRLSSKQGISF